MRDTQHRREGTRFECVCGERLPLTIRADLDATVEHLRLRHPDQYQPFAEYLALYKAGADQTEAKRRIANAYPDSIFAEVVNQI